MIYRHLLQLGDGSRALAEASECAGDQGKFWEVRELIYGRQSELAGTVVFATVQPLVVAAGLDEAAFKQCFEQRRFQQQVENDYTAAQREGISGRPVLVINGTRIVGAQSFTQYQKVLDAIR